MKRDKLINWLSAELEPENFERIDYSLNGLQVGSSVREVKKVAVAVDACMDSFRGAVDAGADFLIVHHGLFWGKPIAVTGMHYERISYLLQQDLALYACHLPLDAHPVFGNNAGLADKLNLQKREPFGEYRGSMIGVKGELVADAALLDIQKQLGIADESSVTVLPFGKKQIRTVGIISGGAATDVLQAMDDGLDLYITGEPSHQIYHTCLEGEINMIAGGHYETETYGPRLLGKKISEELGLPTVFIDAPTGL